MNLDVFCTFNHKICLKTHENMHDCISATIFQEFSIFFWWFFMHFLEILSKIGHFGRWFLEIPLTYDFYIRFILFCRVCRVRLEAPYTFVGQTFFMYISPLININFYLFLGPLVLQNTLQNKTEANLTDFVKGKSRNNLTKFWWKLLFEN